MEATSSAGISSRARAAVPGAFAGAVSVIVVMPIFYPLGRVFDPSFGGDGPTSLLSELALGTAGGIMLSPIAAIIGGMLGLRLQARPIGLKLAAALVMLAVGVAVCTFIALNGGLIDESGSASSVLFVLTLGALAGTAAVAVFARARRIVSTNVDL